MALETHTTVSNAAIASLVDPSFFGFSSRLVARLALGYLEAFGGNGVDEVSNLLCLVGPGLVIPGPLLEVVSAAAALHGPDRIPTTVPYASPPVQSSWTA